MSFFSFSFVVFWIKGAGQSGRKNGIDEKDAEDIFHGVKQGDKMSNALDKYNVNPNTGEKLDPAGEDIGNMDEAFPK